MAWLSCCVDNGVWFDFGDQVSELCPIPDIQLMMLKALESGLQAIPVPGSVTLCAEENSSHVVVNSVHVPASAAKEGYHFTANKAAGTRYE